MASADTLMVDGERVLGAIEEPSELLLLLLLLESCVTSVTKKLWRPTSQLKVAMTACMTLARHDDEVQCYTNNSHLTSCNKKNGTKA